MADLRLRTFLAGQFIQLNSALELATGVLSKADRTSAVKACLAEAILNLAAEGEANPIKLSETALTRVRESCSACRGCCGLSNMLQIQPSQIRPVKLRCRFEMMAADAPPSHEFCVFEFPGCKGCSKAQHTVRTVGSSEDPIKSEALRAWAARASRFKK